VGPIHAACVDGDNVTIGATRVWGGSPSEAVEAAAAAGGWGLPLDGAEHPLSEALGPLAGPDAAARAAADLAAVAATSPFAPAVVGRKPVAARWGARAAAPRDQRGALPLVGRVSVPDGPETWCVVGLGGRGLTYHALLGRWLAEETVGGAPGSVPVELRGGADASQKRRWERECT